MVTVIAFVSGVFIGACGLACVEFALESKPKASQIATWLLLMLNIWLTASIYLWGGHK